MPSNHDHTDAPVQSQDNDVERLSQDLKDQVQHAKARISDRYAKLIEHPSFDPASDEDA